MGLHDENVRVDAMLSECSVRAGPEKSRSGNVALSRSYAMFTTRGNETSVKKTLL